MKAKHIAIRTCVGCLRKRAKMDLVRFVLSKEGLKVGNVPGRGFYLCSDPSCLVLASKRKRFVGEVLNKLNSEDKRLLFDMLSREKKLDSNSHGGVIYSDCAGGVLLG